MACSDFIPFRSRCRGWKLALIKFAIVDESRIQTITLAHPIDGTSNSHIRIWNIFCRIHSWALCTLQHRARRKHHLTNRSGHD